MPNATDLLKNARTAGEGWGSGTLCTPRVTVCGGASLGPAASYRPLDPGGRRSHLPGISQAPAPVTAPPQGLPRLDSDPLDPIQAPSVDSGTPGMDSRPQSRLQGPQSWTPPSKAAFGTLTAGLEAQGRHGDPWEASGTPRTGFEPPR